MKSSEEKLKQIRHRVEQANRDSAKTDTEKLPHLYLEALMDIKYITYLNEAEECIACERGEKYIHTCDKAPWNPKKDTQEFTERDYYRCIQKHIFHKFRKGGCVRCGQTDPKKNNMCETCGGIGIKNPSFHRPGGVNGKVCPKCQGTGKKNTTSKKFCNGGCVKNLLHEDKLGPEIRKALKKEEPSLCTCVGTYKTLMVKSNPDCPVHRGKPSVQVSNINHKNCTCQFLGCLSQKRRSWTTKKVNPKCPVHGNLHNHHIENGKCIHKGCDFEFPPKEPKLPSLEIRRICSKKDDNFSDTDMIESILDYLDEEAK